MALKALIAGALPDELKDYYKPVDGEDEKFVLDVESSDGWALEDVGGLKTALSKERTAREKAEKFAKAFEGLDADDVKAKIEELENLRGLDPSKEADKLAEAKVEALKKQLSEKHQKELEAERQKATRYRDRVYDREIRAAAVEAIASEKGVPELLLPHVTAHTRLRETDDGQFLVEVVDAQGNVRIGDSKGTPMTIKQLVAEMKNSDVFGRAFEGTGSSGSGSHGSNGNGPPPGMKKYSEMSVDEKSGFISKHGIDAWTKKINEESSKA